MRSPVLPPMRMNAAETSASSAIAPCTPLTVVSRSRTTAEIDTFISDVSTTSTNMAIASRIARRPLNGTEAPLSALMAQPTTVSIPSARPDPDSASGRRITVDTGRAGAYAHGRTAPRGIRRTECRDRRRGLMNTNTVIVARIADTLPCEAARP